VVIFVCDMQIFYFLDKSKISHTNSHGPARWGKSWRNWRKFV